jgi:chromosome partitioning protein
MPRIIAIANHKGGVGKTTTSLNLGHALAADEAGRVLLCDLDPQASLTKLILAPEAENPRATVYDLLVGKGLDLAADRVIRPTPNSNVFLLPAHADLAKVEMELASRLNREHLLARLLQSLDEPFDFILLDCPPALNLLTTNALAAAHEVLIPVEAGFLELEALDAFLGTVEEIRRELNPELRVKGILLTKHRAMTDHDRTILEGLRDAQPEVVFRSVIPYSGRAKESVAARQSVLTYDPDSPLADAYRSLARELLHHA